jgi:hypothetical protein
MTATDSSTLCPECGLVFISPSNVVMTTRAEVWLEAFTYRICIFVVVPSVLFLTVPELLCPLTGRVLPLQQPPLLLSPLLLALLLLCNANRREGDEHTHFPDGNRINSNNRMTAAVEHMAVPVP